MSGWRPEGGEPPDDAGRFGPQDQPPQQGTHGQSGQYGQPGQYGQYGQYGQPEQPGRPSQYGWPAQDGQSGDGDQNRYGAYGQPSGAVPSWGADSWTGTPPPTGADQYRYGQYGTPSSQSLPPGFHPGDRPGIIPLRPMSVGEILDGAFRAIRANPKATFGLSLLIMGVTAVIEAAVIALIMNATLLPLLGQGAADVGMQSLGTGLLASTVGALFAVLGVFVASIVLTALLIVSVSESVVGRVATIGQIWRAAKGQLWRLVGLTVLLALLSFVGLMVLAAAVAILTALLIQVFDASPFALVPVIFVAYLGFLVAIAYFVVRFMLASPALMLERIGPAAAIGRSWRLSRGHFWRIFGIMILATLIVVILSVAMLVPVSALTSLVPVGPDTLVVISIVMNVLQVLVSALTTPFMAAVVALTYIDVRMRKEGLDVALARAASSERTG